MDFQYYMDVRKVGSAWKLNAQVKNVAGTSASVTSTGSISAATWTHVAFTFDGSTVRLYINGLADGATASLSGSIRTTAHPIRVGHYLGSTLYFTGSIDEVQLWDRALPVDEIVQYSSADLPVLRLDMESLRSDGKLADFAGKGNAGTVFATSIAEGRIGFGRTFAPTASSVNVTDSASLNFNTAGLTVSAYVLAPSAPTSDVSLVAKKGEFYLNLSSDGLIRFTVYTKAPLTSALPLPLNRWVRVSASSDATTMALYFDDVLMATAVGTKPVDTVNQLTLGRAEGCPTACSRFLGALDEVVVYTKAIVQAALAKSSARGVLLNPNATDTDYDGLADGQELFVKSVKTPKRTPLPDQRWTFSDAMTLPSGGPAWAVASAMLMTGFTHPDMGQVEARIVDNAPSPYGRSVVLRQYANAGQANNFTSYDLMNLGVPRDELVFGGPWFAYAYDRTAGRTGQIEYAQIQVTMHTMPNRADTDADGLNDSEEVNFASDGFQTNPWTADTDADGISDGLESTGWSRSGSTIIANPNGFKTDPTRADTDHDGVRDDRDYVPLGDAFITVRIISATVFGGADDDPTPNTLEPFVEVSYNASFAYTAYASAASGGTATFGHTYSANVADDQRYVNVYFWANDYDPDDTHDAFAINGTSTFASASHDLSRGPGYTTYANFTGSGTLRAAPLRVTITTVVPSRVTTYVLLPEDYAGLYNVTNAAGATVGRRYVGEPRFVPILLNLTRSTSSEAVAILVPRSVFFDTQLYAMLAARTLPPELASTLTYRQNDSAASSNSDALQEILSGEVSSTIDNNTYALLLSYLYNNATWNLTHVLWQIDDPASGNGLFLYSFPDDALRLVGYKPLASTPSTLYRFCPTANCGANPVDKPIWERIWEGIVSTVLQWIVSAAVFAANAFAKLVEILAQVGNWLADLTSGDPVRVARAVQAAQKVFDGIRDAIVATVTQILLGAISGILTTLGTLLAGLLGPLSGDIALYTQSGNPESSDLDNGIVRNVVMIAGVFALIPVAIRAVEAIVAAATLGLEWVVSKLASKVVSEFIVRTLAFTAFVISASIVLSNISPVDAWAEEASMDVLRGIGFPVSVSSLFGSLALKLFKLASAELVSKATFLKRMVAVGGSLFGMVYLGLNLAQLRGPARMVADFFMLLVTMISLAIYYTESFNPISAGLDFISSIGLIFEKIVVYGSPLVIAGAMLVRWQTHGYD